MTKDILLESARKALHGSELELFEKSLESPSCQKFRLVAETCEALAKEELIKNAIREYCDPVVTTHYKLSYDLLNNTYEYLITDTEVKEPIFVK